MLFSIIYYNLKLIKILLKAFSAYQKNLSDFYPIFQRKGNSM